MLSLPPVPSVSKEQLAGFLLAVASAFFNGCFSVPSKLCRRKPDFVIFTVFVALGCGLSSFAVVALSTVLDISVGFSWWGSLSGVLALGGLLACFAALPLLGLATASATWSCVAVLVSFLWGSIGPSPVKKPMKSSDLSGLAVILLLVGATILNLSSQILHLLTGHSNSRAPRPEPMPHASFPSGRQASIAAASAVPSLALAQTESVGISLEEASSKEMLLVTPSAPSNFPKVLGLCLAASAGLCGGSILVPTEYDAEELQGLGAMLSFGLGSSSTGLLMGLLYWTACRRGRRLREELSCEMGFLGLVAGALWNAGNICQLLAQKRFNLAYGISYPILQCGLLVSGLIGIACFGEVRGKAILIFWAGAMLLIGGVVLLGLYGPGA